ncbi:MAG: hypothetical protein U5K71_13190 [Gracilimonas sp.]|nr:hypothetical protein [Gracilimonas sp.]
MKGGADRLNQEDHGSVNHIKSFETKSEALKWENHIKRQKSRDFIERLIASEDNEYEE